jgi:hypothetical protein
VITSGSTTTGMPEVTQITWIESRDALKGYIFSYLLSCLMGGKK